jgi:hypothetical protein
MKKIFFLLLAGCTLCVWNSEAQNPISNITASYQYPELTQVQLSAMSPLQLQMERISLSVNVSITEGQNLSKILVLLGTSEGSSDVFYKEFDYGTAGVFADGTSYTTSGNGVALGLGSFSGVEHYYIEVTALMQDGSQGTGVRTIVQ